MVRGVPLRAARFVVVLGALTSLAVGGASPAAAAGTVAFGDEQSLVIDLGESTSGDVLIVNTALAGAVSVHLQMTGPAAEFFEAPAASDMSPGGTTVTVTWDDESVPSQGTLVLIGGDGSLDRKTVRLVGTPVGDTAPGDGVLVPGTFDTLSVNATSFVPSYFRPLPSAWKWWLFTVVVAGLTVLLFNFYRDVRERNFRVAAAMSLAVVLGVGATVVLFSGAAAATIGGQRDAAVDTRTWSVFPSAVSRVEGDLAGTNGLFGVLALDDGRLSASYLPSAGSYAGTVDTLPEGDGGDVKLAVTVRDWWIYAAIAVGLGVVIGIMLGVVYARRPEAGYDVEAKELRRKIAHNESEWQRISVGQPWSEPYRIAPFLLQRIDDVDGQASTDVAAATTELKKIGALLASVDGLRDEVQRLADERTRLVQRFVKLVDVDRSSRGWLTSLAAPLPLIGTTDQAGKALEQRAADAVTAAGVAAATPPVADDLIQLATEIAAIPVTRVDEMVRLHEHWTTQVGNLLSARDVDALTSITGEIQKIRTAVKAIARAADEEDAAVAAVPYSGTRSLPWKGQLRVLLARAADGDSGLPERVPLSAPGERDDLQTVSVTVRGLAQGAQVRWDFSDGSMSPPFAAPAPEDDGTTTVTIQHVFGGASESVSAVLRNEFGDHLATWNGRVTTTGRAKRTRTGFAADNAAIAVVGGVVAVGSGMGALYLTDATWGSAGDYVAALLWGAVTVEAVKAVITLVADRRPTPP